MISKSHQPNVMDTVMATVALFSYVLAGYTNSIINVPITRAFGGLLYFLSLYYSSGSALGGIVLAACQLTLCGRLAASEVVS
eukprot:6462005-Amphidinium_carterae.1